MADQLRRSNRKRALKSEPKPMAKRQKREKCVESKIDRADSDAAAAPITNICNELIDRIFDFLDVKSLTNVAGTCKRLQSAASAKFGQKFGKKRISLCAEKHPVLRSEDRGDIVVAGLGSALPFLRCFGAEISNLKLSSYSCRNSMLYQYIQQYCADTVATLHFDMDCMFPAEIFANSKPFKNVQKIDISRGDLGKQLLSFAKWFPNLRGLAISGRNSVDASATGVYCPHLEHLSVQLTSSAKMFSSTNIKKLLHANPQLKSLKIDLLPTKDFGPLMKMLDKNTSLTKLEIVGEVKGMNAVELNRLTKLHPLLTELAWTVEKNTVGDAVFLSHALKSFTSLTFLLFGPYKWDGLLSQLNSQWQRNISQEDKHCKKLVLSH